MLGARAADHGGHHEHALGWQVTAAALGGSGARQCEPRAARGRHELRRDGLQLEQLRAADRHGRRAAGPPARRAEAAELRRACDARPRARHAGAYGSLLAALLRRCPGAQGVLFDQPQARAASPPACSLARCARHPAHAVLRCRPAPAPLGGQHRPPGLPCASPPTLPYPAKRCPLRPQVVERARKEWCAKHAALLPRAEFCAGDFFEPGAPGALAGHALSRAPGCCRLAATTRCRARAGLLQARGEGPARVGFRRAAAARQAPYRRAATATRTCSGLSSTTGTTRAP